MTPDPTSTALELSGVAVSLGGRPVLRDVDLVVPRGQTLALLGPNGSGKSTLVRTAVGLVPPRQGRVALFGTPLASYDAWHRIGYVPQRSAAPTGVPASVTEVVSSGRLSRRRVLVPMGRRDRTAVREALEAVGLTDRASQPVATLSGGQQQRVLMARALAGEPDLMLLDEPNAGVDAYSQQRIADTLATLKAAGGTLVLVLHELGPFAPLIDRVVVLRDGRPAYDGPPDVLDDHGGLHLGDGLDHGHDHGHHHVGPPLRPEVVPGVRAPLDRGH